MGKEIYLIRGSEAESYGDFRERIMRAAAGVARELQPEKLKFTITDKSPPKLSVIPFKKSKIAAVSVSVKNDGMIKSLIKEDGFCGAYRVEEALPVAYTKDWEDGEASPGVCLLTLFKRRKGIDYSSFIDRWHNSHTPLSLRIHPLWNYVRNVVDRPLSDPAAPFEGIVEENFRTASDLLNPFRFFGNPLIILYRMLQVYTDTKAFIDYPSMETYLTNEYHMLS